MIDGSCSNGGLQEGENSVGENREHVVPLVMTVIGWRLQRWGISEHNRLKTKKQNPLHRFECSAQT